MPNPLYTSAAEVVPVQPATRFFDPGESLGIMQRYGMSAANRAFAEDALKSANEIDRAANFDPVDRRNRLEQHEWNREIKGRADVEYDRKKEQESAFGAFAKEVYALDFDNDPEAEKKLGTMASDPLLADYEPARAILNHRFGELDLRRRERMQQADKENTLEWKLATEAGVDPTSLYNKDGKLDIGKTVEAIRALQDRETQAKAGRVRTDTLTDAVGKEDGVLFLPETDIDAELTGRVKGLVDAGYDKKLVLHDVGGINKVLTDNPTIPKEAFVAQVTDLAKRLNIPDDEDRTVRLAAALNNKAELPPELKSVVTSAERVWNAHFAKQRRATKPAATTATSDQTPARNWVNQAKARQ
jgi:hypothetical protein